MEGVMQNKIEKIRKLKEERKQVHDKKNLREKKRDGTNGLKEVESMGRESLESVQKPNSWTYNFVEGGHILCLDYKPVLADFEQKKQKSGRIFIT